MFRSVALIALCLSSFALCGCPGQARTSIPPAERQFKATYSTKLDRKKAYDALEVELVRSFNNAKAVTQVKQPENGRLVIQAQMFVTVRDLGFGQHSTGYLPYIMDAKLDDGSASFLFEVSGPSDVSLGMNADRAYPDDMIPVLVQFQGIADRLSLAIGGELKTRTDIPRPAEKPAAARPANSD
jgi:hypothetical protein